MKTRENRVVHINCLRNNGIHTTFAGSSDSVGKDRSDDSIKQMPTIELIKPIKCPQAELEQTAVADTDELACTTSLELLPVKKKIRIRECADLRHWWDEEENQEESVECA